MYGPDRYFIIIPVCERLTQAGVFFLDFRKPTNLVVPNLTKNLFLFYIECAETFALTLFFMIFAHYNYQKGCYMITYGQ